MSGKSSAAEAFCTTTPRSSASSNRAFQTGLPYKHVHVNQSDPKQSATNIFNHEAFCMAIVGSSGCAAL